MQIMDHPSTDPPLPTPQKRCFVNTLTNLSIQPMCVGSFMDISKEIQNPPHIMLAQ